MHQAFDQSDDEVDSDATMPYYGEEEDDDIVKKSGDNDADRSENDDSNVEKSDDDADRSEENDETKSDDDDGDDGKKMEYSKYGRLIKRKKPIDYNML